MKFRFHFICFAGCTEFLGESERESVVVQELSSCSGCKHCAFYITCMPPCPSQVSCFDVHMICNFQVLDDTFASQMQQLLGNSLQEKDLEPPRSIMEVRSMLCKDAPNRKDSNYYI